jgi:DNA adenine methylase
MDLFSESDYLSGDMRIIKAPFAYPGGKSRSLEHLLDLIPVRKTYVEPFGGSASVLLSRPKSRLEVYNDLFGGVVAFYRALRSEPDALIKRLELTVHSKEEFYYCKETWNDEDLTTVERAARWYYTQKYSFGGVGRNWGRVLKGSNNFSGKLVNSLDLLPVIHERFREVQIENQDFIHCLRDYDSKDTVFYLDPPYPTSYKGTYKWELSTERHQELIETCLDLEGFVVLSSYKNSLYDSYSWDDFKEWESRVTVKGYRSESKEVAKECVYIKE